MQIAAGFEPAAISFAATPLHSRGRTREGSLCPSPTLATRPDGGVALQNPSC